MGFFTPHTSTPFGLHLRCTFASPLVHMEASPITYGVKVYWHQRCKKEGLANVHRRCNPNGVAWHGEDAPCTMHLHTSLQSITASHAPAPHVSLPLHLHTIWVAPAVHIRQSFGVSDVSGEPGGIGCTV